jgi:hypothetical protein
VLIKNTFSVYVNTNRVLFLFDGFCELVLYVYAGLLGGHVLGVGCFSNLGAKSCCELLRQFGLCWCFLFVFLFEPFAFSSYCYFLLFEFM